MKRKIISDSRNVENISDKTLRIEVQPAPTNVVGRVKRFVNVHLDCIVSNLKRISSFFTLPPSGKILRTPMGPALQHDTRVNTIACVPFSKCLHVQTVRRFFPRCRYLQ